MLKKVIMICLMLSVSSCSKESKEMVSKNEVTQKVEEVAAAVTDKTKSLMGSSVDLEKSALKWTGYKIASKHFGTIKLKSANLKLEGDKVIGGVVIANMNTMSVDDIAENEGGAKLLGHLKSDDFFGVDKFSEAKLVIGSLDNNKGQGVLTVKGVSKPVDFTYSQAANAFTGKLSFNRTEYDIKYGSGSFFDNLGDKAIKDNVDVDFNIVLK